MVLTPQQRQVLVDLLTQLLRDSATDTVVDFDRLVCRQWLRKVAMGAAVGLPQLQRTYEMLELLDYSYEAECPWYRTFAYSTDVTLPESGSKVKLANVRELIRLRSELLLAYPGGVDYQALHRLQAFYVEQIRQRIWTVINAHPTTVV